MRRALVSLVVVCTTWGTIPLLTRDVDLTPAAIVLVRVWTAVLGLALVAALRRRASTAVTATAHDTATDAAVPRFAGRPSPRALLVGPLLAVHWTAMFAGYQRAPADVVVFVVFLAPIGIAVVAPRALGERLTARTVAALAVAVAGFALITGPALDGARAAGVAWATLSAATLVVLVVVSKPLAESLGGFRLSRIELTGAGVVLLPVAVLADWSGATGRDWAALVVLGVVHTGIGVAVYLDALAKVPATAVGILGYLEPVAVVVFSWLFLADVPSLTTVTGGALIVVAGVLVVRAAAASTPEVPVHVPG